MENNVDSTTWVRVKIAVAIIGCIGALGAALIMIIPNLLGPQTLPTSTANVPSTSAPAILPALTPFSAQPPSAPTLVYPTNLSVTITPIPLQGNQVVTIPENTFTEFYSGNLTITISYASKYLNQVSAYISSPGYPILTINGKHVGYKTIYAANESYEIQIMGVTEDPSGGASTVEISVLKLDNLPQAKAPVIVLAKEKQEVAEATIGAFDSGSLIIAVTYASRYLNQVSVEISAPTYEVLSFNGKPIGYKTQYQTEKKYEIQIVGITDYDGYATVTFTVTVLQ